MQIGDINVPNSIINLEVQVALLTRLVEHLANRASPADRPTQQQIDGFRQAAQSEVINKYPNMGIQFR
jgi:hypothetical protein